MELYFYFIIFFLILLAIFLYVKKNFLNKEGLSNPFDFIIKIFKFIGTMIISIGTIFTLIGDIFDIISCPYSIFSNIGTCSYYFSLDVFFYFIYLIMWILIYIFIFFPCWISIAALCIFVGDIVGCYDITMDDVCPSKTSFFKSIDYFLFYTFGIKKFLYRDKDDLKKCYCIKPIELAFDPLKEKIIVDELSKVKDKNNGLLFFIALMIILVLYMKNK